MAATTTIDDNDHHYRKAKMNNRLSLFDHEKCITYGHHKDSHDEQHYYDPDDQSMDRLIDEMNKKIKSLEESLDLRSQMYEELEIKFEKQKIKHRETLWKLRFELLKNILIIIFFYKIFLRKFIQDKNNDNILQSNNPRQQQKPDHNFIVNDEEDNEDLMSLMMMNSKIGNNIDDSALSLSSTNNETIVINSSASSNDIELITQNGISFCYP